MSNYDDAENVVVDVQHLEYLGKPIDKKKYRREWDEYICSDGNIFDDLDGAKAHEHGKILNPVMWLLFKTKTDPEWGDIFYQKIKEYSITGLDDFFNLGERVYDLIDSLKQAWFAYSGERE